MTGFTFRTLCKWTKHFRELFGGAVYFEDVLFGGPGIKFEANDTKHGNGKTIGGPKCKDFRS